MADPRIRYDILANAEGEEDVARLAAELEKLDEAIDPQAAARAKALAEEMRALADKRAGIEAFLRALSEADAAARALEETQQAARKLAQAIDSVDTPSKRQLGQQEKLREAVERTQRAYTEKTATLSNARTAIERLGVGTTDLGNKQQVLSTALANTRTQAAQLAAGYQATAAAATASAATQARAQDRVGTALEGLNGTYQRLQSVAAVAIGGGIFTGLLRDVAATADAYNNLQARIKLVTGEGQAFTQAFEEVAAIAQRTNSSLETTGTLFARIATAGRDIGLSQQGALALTETINQTLAISGASAASSDAAITQLIQGLQSGVLRGEEFNSVVEQSPRLAQALADGLGIARGELRRLANEGQLTSEVVIQALQGQSEAVQREFATLPPTVGRAIQNLSNSWTLYVGEVDRANGISVAAANVINGLAGNLETLGTVLLGVGKAAAAYKALQLAQSFLGIGEAARAAAASKATDTAATVAGTVATTANTAATAANTAAKVANANASKAGALAWGTLADGVRIGGKEAEKSAGLLQRAGGAAGAALSLVRGALGGPLALLTIATNYREIGTAIGEATAKLFGYGKQLEQNEAILAAEQKALAASSAARAAATAKAEAARQAALGLTLQSKALVAEFDQVVKQGQPVEEALEKVTKALQLGNGEGIKTALAALDSLALNGKITADQLRSTLSGALNGLDLGAFEVRARAAFDGSEQGARRLQAAIDAIALESLRRAGTSADELRTGFSAAATSAINDVDALAVTLDKLGTDADTSGRLLATALDKATTAAGTERAVQAVIERLEALGKQGKLSGDQLAEGLDKARAKLDELKPGINSLTEAYKQFGLKSRAELQAVADKNAQAWRVIKADATLTLAQKQSAFRQYAEAAIAANGGVASSELRLQASQLQVQLQVDKTGKAIVTSMGNAERAVEGATRKFNALGREVNELGEDINQLAGGISDPRLTGVRQPGTAGANDAQGNLPQIDSFGRLIRGTPNGGITRTGAGQIPPPPGNPADYFFNTNRRGEGPFGLGVWELTPEAAAREAEFIRNPDGRVPAPAPPTSSGISGPAGGRVAPAPPPQPTSTATPASAGGVPMRTVRVELVVAGRTFPVQTGEATANDLLAAIERAKLTGG